MSGRKQTGQKKHRTVRAIATSEKSLPQVACVCNNLLSFIQGSTKKSMKQQQQSGKSAGSKELNCKKMFHGDVTRIHQTSTQCRDHKSIQHSSSVVSQALCTGRLV